MNLTKRDMPSTPIRTWCRKCQKPLDWWTLSFDVMRGGRYAGVETPVLTVHCHGETYMLGCDPQPDVIADFMRDWEEYRSGRKVLEIIQKDNDPYRDA